MKSIHRIVSFLVLFTLALTSIGGDGCWSDLTSTPTADHDCCAGNDVHYTCTAQVRTEDMLKSDGLGVSTVCVSGYPLCASSVQNAQDQVTNYAKLKYATAMQTATVQLVQCTPMARCIAVTKPQHNGPIPHDYDGSEPNGATLLDYDGACIGVTPTGDAGAPPTACLGVGGVCGDCMNANCCAQVAACGDDPDCASVLNYWLGSGPENTALDDAAQSLAACFSGSCSDACSPYFGGIRRIDHEGAW